MKYFFKKIAVFVSAVFLSQAVLANESLLQKLSNQLSLNSNRQNSCTSIDGKTYNLSIYPKDNKSKASLSLEYVGSFSGIELHIFEYREHHVSSVTEVDNQITVIYEHKYNNETYKDVYSFDSAGNLLFVEKSRLSTGFFGGQSYKTEVDCRL